MEQSKTNKKGRIIKGVVVSDKMNKTVVVAATRLKEHPKYRKRYRVTRRYKAHDEKNVFKVGDKVVIGESLPLSKEKRWIVNGLVENSKPKEKEVLLKG